VEYGSSSKTCGISAPSEFNPATVSKFYNANYAKKSAIVNRRLYSNGLYTEFSSFCLKIITGSLHLGPNCDRDL